MSSTLVPCPKQIGRSDLIIDARQANAMCETSRGATGHVVLASSADDRAEYLYLTCRYSKVR